MHKQNDPRFWGRWAASGATPALLGQLGDIKSDIAIVNSRLTAGAVVTRNPVTKKFRNLRGFRTELTYELGRKVLGQ